MAKIKDTLSELLCYEGKVQAAQFSFENPGARCKKWVTEDLINVKQEYISSLVLAISVLLDKCIAEKLDVYVLMGGQDHE